MLRPHSLLAAMALQMGLWFGTHDDRIGQCVECGATWVIGPGTGHRVSRRYCSEKCADAVRYRLKKAKHWEPFGGRADADHPLQCRDASSPGCCARTKKTAAPWLKGRRSGAEGTVGSAYQSYCTRMPKASMSAHWP